MESEVFYRIFEELFPGRRVLLKTNYEKGFFWALFFGEVRLFNGVFLRGEYSIGFLFLSWGGFHIF